MAQIYPLEERDRNWERTVLRHFRKQKRGVIKPLSKREIKNLTEEIFLEE